ncbi:PREDICTED: uncharacterized protein C4orf45 homolog [Gavialis gangeticus]|uniref:uncharacterized protein C4orf45 homolog n=1 Tax=Gavialis gangeticus TaxID=94835 RepID=UPI00092F4EEE|nr:PREDICTED: uncharacterized protein C4orf45 homolog [Gavialis gangeticus]
MPLKTHSPSQQAGFSGKRLVFTGPDALWDYRTKQPDYTRYIGATSPALEGTSDLDYLLRPSSHNPTVPAHRHCYAGEIGWGVREFSHLGKRNLSGMQIMNGLFRQAAEDKSTHRYQTPWQPPPDILDKQGNNARSRLAWNWTDYEDYSHPKSKWSAMREDNHTSLAPLQPTVKQLPAAKSK